MAEVILETTQIRDWETFHDVCAETFGFPEFYGRNMDAWIDCLSYLDADDGMCRFLLSPGETLQIILPNFEVFQAVVPEVAAAFLDCVAFVNRRYNDRNDVPRLILVLL